MSVSASIEAAALLSSLRMRIQHRYVPHYGWPALALRRWQTYLEASADMREADVVFHIDCDARAGTASST